MYCFAHLGGQAMMNLRRIEEDILSTGKVDGHHLEMLRHYLYANGKIDRSKADFLVELHKRVQLIAPGLNDFFYRAIKDHMLANGRIDAEKTAWLREMLLADSKIDDEERKFLHELRGEANQVCREFEALFAECMKTPAEQRTCG
jgi:hypothetical protein